jgi:plastocyanin
MNNIAFFGGTAILGLSLILAACNSASTTTGGTDTVACTVKTTLNSLYSPDTCNVKVGDKISIEASGLHPLQGVTAGGPIDSTKSTSTTLTVTVDKAGKFDFFCTNHGVNGGLMKGTINVSN